MDDVEFVDCSVILFTHFQGLEGRYPGSAQVGMNLELPEVERWVVSTPLGVTAEEFVLEKGVLYRPSLSGYANPRNLESNGSQTHWNDCMHDFLLEASEIGPSWAPGFKHFGASQYFAPMKGAIKWSFTSNWISPKLRPGTVVELPVPREDVRSKVWSAGVSQSVIDVAYRDVDRFFREDRGRFAEVESTYFDSKTLTQRVILLREDASRVDVDVRICKWRDVEFTKDTFQQQAPQTLTTTPTTPLQHELF